MRHYWVRILAGTVCGATGLAMISDGETISRMLAGAVVILFGIANIFARE